MSLMVQSIWLDLCGPLRRDSDPLLRIFAPPGKENFSVRRALFGRLRWTRLTRSSETLVGTRSRIPNLPASEAHAYPKRILSHTNSPFACTPFSEMTRDT